MRQVGALFALTAIAAATGGCAAEHHGNAVDRVAARPLVAQNPNSTAAPRATPKEYRAPIRAYRRYVARQLRSMSGAVDRLRGAIAAGDASAGRAAWRAAHARYQSIGAAYGAFGEFDRAVAGTPSGLSRGVRDAHFTGLHRVELALFGRRSLTDARGAAAGLQRALTRLRERVPRLRIDPLEYSLRAHEILEDTLHLQLTGNVAPWSGDAYGAAAANVRGTRIVLSTLAAMIDRRSPPVRLQAQRSLARAAATLASLRRRDGSFPSLDATPQVQRQRVAAAVAAAAEDFASVPEVIDPRRPRPVRGAFGKSPA